MILIILNIICENIFLKNYIKMIFVHKIPKKNLNATFNFLECIWLYLIKYVHKLAYYIIFFKKAI